MKPDMRRVSFKSPVPYTQRAEPKKSQGPVRATRADEGKKVLLTALTQPSGLNGTNLLQVKQLGQQGVPAAAIARQLGLSVALVKEILKVLGT